MLDRWRHIYVKLWRVWRHKQVDSFWIHFFPKPIRPKLCRYVGRNLDNVDRCDGVRVYSH